jgi:poly(3-hydroxybutyrate) depolymerase
MEILWAEEWGYGKDISFFTALVERLQEKDYNVDAARAFVCGHSAGGTMALFLQNQVDVFCAAGAVESAVGHLEEWDMTRRGRPTMVIWNHADPVLEEYAPPGGEPAYYELTVSTLRRNGSRAPVSESLPTSKGVTSAEILHFPEDGAPKLDILHFHSSPGSHDWQDESWCSFSATEQLVKFFLAFPCK